MTLAILAITGLVLAFLWNLIPSIEFNYLEELEANKRRWQAIYAMQLMQMHKVRRPCMNCDVRPFGIVESEDGKHCNDCGRELNHDPTVWRFTD